MEDDFLWAALAEVEAQRSSRTQQHQPPSAAQTEQAQPQNGTGNPIVQQPPTLHAAPAPRRQFQSHPPQQQQQQQQQQTPVFEQRQQDQQQGWHHRQHHGTQNLPPHGGFPAAQPWGQQQQQQQRPPLHAIQQQQQQQQQDVYKPIPWIQAMFCKPASSSITLPGAAGPAAAATGAPAAAAGPSYQPQTTGIQQQHMQGMVQQQQQHIQGQHMQGQVQPQHMQGQQQVLGACQQQQRAVQPPWGQQQQQVPAPSLPPTLLHPQQQQQQQRPDPQRLQHGGHQGPPPHGAGSSSSSSIAAAGPPLHPVLAPGVQQGCGRAAVPGAGIGAGAASGVVPGAVPYVHPAAAILQAGGSGGGAAVAAAPGRSASGGPSSGSGAGPPVAPTTGPGSGGGGGVLGGGGPEGGGGAAPGSGGGGARTFMSCSLQLAEGGNLQVTFSGYHRQLEAACHRIPGAAHKETAWKQEWVVPRQQQALLRQVLDSLPGITMRITELVPLVDKVIKAAAKAVDDSERYSALSSVRINNSETLEQRLMSFQRDGVKFGLRCGGRVLIGDEMGLGKTVQACALAKCYQDDWPALIVTPSSMRLTWAGALYDWLRVTEDRVLVVLKRADMDAVRTAASMQEARSMFDFIIVSYDLLADLEQVLSALKLQVVVCDESHYIKTSTAKRTKAALPLLQGARRAVLLSGTPALSRPAELLTQLQALMPGARLTRKEYEERYCDMHPRFNKPTGAKNTQELNALLTSAFMIRRKKDEVLKHLPKKLRQQVYLQLDSEGRNQLARLQKDITSLRSLAADAHAMEGKGGEGSLLSGLQQEQQAAIMRAWHSTAELKVTAIRPYLREQLEVLMEEEGQKILVFGHHKQLLDGIEAAVNDFRRSNKGAHSSMSYIRIDGSVPPEKRDNYVQDFQAEENCRVAILQIKAAGVGLTLTAANTVVFAELPWTPAELVQAEDRAHRIGQHSSVNVKLVLLKDSIDEMMWDLLGSKVVTMGKVLDGAEARMEVEGGQHTRKAPAPGPTSAWPPPGGSTEGGGASGGGGRGPGGSGSSSFNHHNAGGGSTGAAGTAAAGTRAITDFFGTQQKQKPGQGGSGGGGGGSGNAGGPPVKKTRM